MTFFSPYVAFCVSGANELLRRIICREVVETYKLLKHTTVQLHLWLSALPHVVVVVLEALPVRVELLQAVRIDVLDAVPTK